MVENLTHKKLYIIQMLETNFFKIGISMDPNDRLKNIQTSNPYKLALIKTYDCEKSFEVEKIIHTKMDKFNANGEWFKFEDNELKNCMKLIENTICVIDKQNCNMDKQKHKTKDKKITTPILKNEPTKPRKIKNTFCCEHCGYETNLKANLALHEATKKHLFNLKKYTLENKNSNIQEHTGKHKCKNCGSVYAHAPGLSRHKKKCKKGIEQDLANDNKLEISSLKEQFSKMQESMIKLLEK